MYTSRQTVLVTLLTVICLYKEFGKMQAIPSISNHPRHRFLENDYEIVTPQQVFSEEELFMQKDTDTDFKITDSHDIQREKMTNKTHKNVARKPGNVTLSKHSVGTYNKSQPRTLKRSSRNHSSLPQPTSPPSQNTSTFFHIKMAAQEFHLHLKPKLDFIHKHFKILHRRSVYINGTRTGKSETENFDPSCFFAGTSISHNDSSAVLHICNGLMGTIMTKDSIYLIEPVPAHLRHNLSNSSQDQQPHVIYKHSTATNIRPHLSPKMASQQATFGRDKLKIKGIRHRVDNICSSGAKSEYNKTFIDQVFKYKLEPQREFHARTKRSLREVRKSRRRHVETIVVVDKDMLKAHGNQNVTTYVLTILNMVSHLFNDNTIGSKINISLVALIFLEGDEPGFVVDHHADQSLTNFCHWQSGLEGTKHDHAILLTGVDICSYQNSPCDTLGFAPIEGMCKRFQSCTINEDTGLGTAFTIAHEIGHNFGMFHDGEGNYCKNFVGNIMAPTLLGHDGMFKWSACSRKYLNKFLRSSQAWCLKDEPKQVAELRFPDKLPGELYNADIQCKWQFGHSARLCMFDFARDLCQSMWCFTGGTKCETKFLPAAEGTSCGPSQMQDMSKLHVHLTTSTVLCYRYLCKNLLMLQWCRKGLCVKYGDEGPKPIDGGWSSFFPWTDCTRTCGGGVKYKERICNYPRAQYGGKYCEGESRVYKKCNIQKCINPVKSFRSIQCEAYNKKPFRGAYYTWEPYFNILEDADICRLYCKANQYDFFFAMSEKVIDGTPCREGSDNVCVEGECQSVGCDNIIGSGAQLDLCGVCHGDNSTCHLIQGVFSDTLSSNAYHRVVTIPKGARSIVIQETSISPSYLALRNKKGTYYLTGNWRVSWPGMYQVAGTFVRYLRPYNEPEKLISTGPTNEELVVEVLVLGKSPKVQYEYSLSKAIDDISPEKHQANYSWGIATSKCSASCAGGKKTISAQCLKNLYEEADQALCDGSSKPDTGLYPCNSQPCPPRWMAEEWSQCSQTCGGGQQRRRVVCIQKVSSREDHRLRSKHCQHLPKPSRRQSCNEQECPPQWYSDSWSKCSKTCGDAQRQRVVTCQSKYKYGHQELPENMCKHVSKPDTTEDCSNKPCQKAQWFLSSWSKCSRTCGLGLRIRSFQCTELMGFGQYLPVGDHMCDHLMKPTVPLTEHCQLGVCKARWFVTPWSKCSRTCGEGVHTRAVKCVDEKSGKLQRLCEENKKPAETGMCMEKACPPIDPACTDSFVWCDLVPVHNLCGHKFYGEKCCHACGG